MKRALLLCTVLLTSCEATRWPDPIAPDDAVKTRWDAIAAVKRNCVDPEEQPERWTTDLWRSTWMVHWEGRRGDIDAQVDKKSGKAFCHYSNMGPPTGLP